MAHVMTDEQRLQALEAYNPQEHLVDIRDKQGNIKQYYPAAYRLYELRLRFPNITIESEIVYMDQEHNLVVVKAWIFDGKTYSESERRASAYKQGLLSALDKVETAAKARASRDFGISTELALDFEDDAVDTPASQAEALVTIKAEVKTLGLARNPSQWSAFKKKVIGRDLPDTKLTAGHIAKLTAAIEQHKNNQAA
ncbi:MAG: hypothetical protein ACJ797_14420 [Ktedonobacteraceae bacterium]